MSFLNSSKTMTKIVCLGAWLLGICLLYVPIMTLIMYSFVGGTTDGGLGIEAYQHLFLNQKMLSALESSMIVALLSATASTVLGGLGAIGLERGRPLARGLIDTLTMAPLVLPEIVFGLGLLIWFIFLRVSLGTQSLVLAHVTFSVSYVLLTVRGRVRTLDVAVDDAARDLGASPWQVFWNVQMPLLAPALFSGWMMAFTLSFDDFLITFFASGPDTITLPIALYSVIKFGASAEVFALASCIFAVSFIGASVLSVFSGTKPLSISS
jgi:ABC-type spermidine/putrescine transport system permease subunit II